MGETGELKDLVSRQGSEMDVDSIEEVIWDSILCKYVVKTKWRGLSDFEITYEPFDELFPQIPRMMLLYLNIFAERRNELYQAFWKKKKGFIMKVLKGKKIVWSPPEKP